MHGRSTSNSVMTKFLYVDLRDLLTERLAKIVEGRVHWACTGVWQHYLKIANVNILNFVVNVHLYKSLIMKREIKTVLSSPVSCTRLHNQHPLKNLA